LGKAEAEELLTALLGEAVGATGRSPLHDLKQLILDKTQGTPFFMEEIVQELREQGVLPGVGARRAVPLPTDLHIPTTVQGILAARIDRLASDEKALLQQLAVIGRQFPMSLLRQVIAQPEAELYRVKGELTLQKSEARDWGLGTGSSPQAPSLQPQDSSGVEQEAEACFLKAIAIAQKQQAKSLELRAVMSLARLRQQQAAQHAARNTFHVTRTKLAEAHRMLSEVFNWFTEGFDTKDLQEAKALLEALSEEPVLGVL
jgi:hypothetical protein